MRSLVAKIVTLSILLMAAGWAHADMTPDQVQITQAGAENLGKMQKNPLVQSVMPLSTAVMIFSLGALSWNYGDYALLGAGLTHEHFASLTGTLGFSGGTVLA